MLDQAGIRELQRAIDLMDAAGRTHAPVAIDTMRKIIEGVRRMTWLQYVPHANVQAFLDLGWVHEHDLDETHHGHYSVLLKWIGEGNPPQPKAEVAQ